MTSDSIQSPATILVRKYGGSSLTSVERICAVARDICAQRAAGHEMVIVVSAMGSTTDELLALARQANPDPPRRELDMLLSVGERITMSLLSMALAAEGCSAISYTGSQCAIITDGSHTDARIKEVKGDRVRQSLAEGHVVVVAGFQGVSEAREITTLGRGGSDTTAVALAAALGATRCEILKDVEGVMTADPRQVPAARCHETLSYQELAEVAASGCGVVHQRAVRYAAEHGVPLFVGSSFHPGPGTRIAPDTSPPPTAVPCAVYRPLTLIVDEEVACLELSAGNSQPAGAWAEALAARTTPAEFRVEWWTEQGAFHWGAIAAPATLAPLREAAAEVVARVGGQITYRDCLACISLAGGKPPTWSVARDRLSEFLDVQGIRDWQLRVDGSALRLLVPAACLSRLLPLLHAEFYPA